MSHCNIDIDLLECHAQLIKMSKNSSEGEVPIDMFVFSHPLYFLHHGDPIVGPLYKDYEKAFVIFECVNN